MFKMKTQSQALKVSAFAVLLVAALTVESSSRLQEYPNFFGWYLQTSRGLQQLDEQPVTWRSGLSGVCGLWGMEGLSKEPSVVVTTARPTALVYEQDVDIAKVQLGRLTFIDKIEPQRLMKEPPDPPFFQNLCGVPYGVPIPLKLWMLTETIPLRRGPVQGKPGLYRIEPVKDLSDGVYVLFPGDFVGVARIRDVGRKIVMPFRVQGVGIKSDQSKPELQPVSLSFNRALLSQGVRNGEPVGVSDRFPTSATTLVCYLVVSHEQAGQVIEFVWIQPDGQERGRSSTVLTAPRGGQAQFAYGALRPRTLLQPGQWRADIYVDGALAKYIEFTVY
jgi:hypothetical protein